MKFYKQLFRHQPERDVIGDCHRTAIACLLDLQPSEVPHFAQRTWDASEEAFDREVRAWLRTKGYTLAAVAFRADSVEEFLKIMEIASPGTYYLLGGTSRNGTSHTVIGCGGVIAHDPALDASGIVGPIDGCYHVHWLIPAQFHKDRAAT